MIKKVVIAAVCITIGTTIQAAEIHPHALDMKEIQLLIRSDAKKQDGKEEDTKKEAARKKKLSSYSHLQHQVQQNQTNKPKTKV